MGRAPAIDKLHAGDESKHMPQGMPGGGPGGPQNRSSSSSTGSSEA
ncbi:MAG TPA: hypothetical protein VEI83_06925 [Acidimicrobiales bacterium]|nr:hypothetical protein [Acidimicrobiales bacterium]